MHVHRGLQDAADLLDKTIFRVIACCTAVSSPVGKAVEPFLGACLDLWAFLASPEKPWEDVGCLGPAHQIVVPREVELLAFVSAYP